MQKLLKAISSSLTLDETLEPLQLAKQLENLTSGNVRFTTIPILGFDNNSPVGSVEDIDATAMPDFINSVLGVASAYDKAKAASPSSVSVAVANDTSKNSGIEQTNAAALRKLGFTVTVPPASSTVLAKTTVKYHPGSEAAAKAVANAVPGAALRMDSTVNGVVLALGDNAVQAGTLSHATGATAPASSSPSSNAASLPPVTTGNQASGCIN